MLIGSSVRAAEWYFRSSLDRYIWIFGMLCAWAHPFADKALNAIDEMSIRSRMIARSIIFGITAALFAVWCALIERPDKLCLQAPPALCTAAVHVALSICYWSCCRIVLSRVYLTATVPLRRYQHVFILDKIAYNKLHPFTSWMPILCWIVVRLQVSRMFRRGSSMSSAALSVYHAELANLG